jgi:hypothetical protein
MTNNLKIEEQAKAMHKSEMGSLKGVIINVFQENNYNETFGGNRNNKQLIDFLLSIEFIYSKKLEVTTSQSNGSNK